MANELAITTPGITMRIVNFFDHLIEQAVIEQEALEQLLASPVQNGEAVSIFQAARTSPTVSQ